MHAYVIHDHCILHLSGNRYAVLDGDARKLAEYDSYADALALAKARMLEDDVMRTAAEASALREKIEPAPFDTQPVPAEAATEV